MKLHTMILLTLLLIITFTALAWGQPGLPGPPGQAPIDGGLGILAALGGGYAIKKLRDRKRG